MSLAATAPLGGASGAAGEGLPRKFISFLVNGHPYALPLERVAEIVPWRELNKLPHMPRSVEGILDLRGRVIPVISLRTRMGLPPLESTQGTFILVLDLAGPPAAVLVDRVESVTTVLPDQLLPGSRLLAGMEGAWVCGFILQDSRVIAELDPALVAALGPVRGRGADALASLSLEQRMDEGLRNLLALAPPKDMGDPRRKIIPQIEESLKFTEQEMDKVLLKVEEMLSGTDAIFHQLVFLKQEAALGHLKGQESKIAELEKAGQAIQDSVFELIGTVQFQDISRQKLERVLHHLQGMQGLLTARLRDEGRHEL
ncbi:MAG TPA: chemotaxis protein CheW [Holophagaceae bacterium]|nr:chemotaxis protein CheW [Holophagaceae bacterium]